MRKAAALTETKKFPVSAIGKVQKLHSTIFGPSLRIVSSYSFRLIQDRQFWLTGWLLMRFAGKYSMFVQPIHKRLRAFAVQ